MAVHASRVSVADEAVLLMPVASNDVTPGQTVVVRNLGVAVVFLGGPSVTTSQGWPLKAGEVYAFDANEADRLYGVADDPSVVAVLQVGV